MTEDGLASMGYSEVVVFRPGMLADGVWKGTRPLAENFLRSVVVVVCREEMLINEIMIPQSL